MFGRQKVAALVAEFLGTLILALAVLATVYGQTGFPLFLAMAAGLTLGLLTLVLGSISGAHLNPVVTIALWTTRKLRTTQAIVYVTAQMLGGFAAWQLTQYLLNRPLQNSAGDSLNLQVLLGEAIGAFVFTFVIAAAVSRAYTGGKLAVTNGLGLMIGMLLASISSNGVINPALAVGIQSWSWAYSLGPLAGAVIGMNVYGLVFGPIDNPKPRAVKAVVVAVAKKAKAKAKVVKKRVTKKKK